MNSWIHINVPAFIQQSSEVEVTAMWENRKVWDFTQAKVLRTELKDISYKETRLLGEDTANGKKEKCIYT